MAVHTSSKVTVVPALLLGFVSLAASPGAAASAVRVMSLDVALIEGIVGRTGSVQDGRLKFTVPQNDLEVRVDGFEIVPPMGLGSWVVFAPASTGAVLMGDLVVRESEIAAAQKALVGHGIEVTALHNHFVRDDPHVMYMHLGGSGPEDELAHGVGAALDTIAASRGGDPATAEARAVANSLDVGRITEILGHDGVLDRGVYKVTIGRPDVDLHAHGVQVNAFMGFNTWSAWQGSPQRAAVAGDFAVLQAEVEPVMAALVDADIEVVAVHNHMVHEEPRVFFLHYWGVGQAEELARGLRNALDRTGG